MLAGGDEPFTGRRGEVERLDALWAAAAEGTRQVVLVSGEPGIGKTSLAAETARRVHEQGGAVLYGRCDEEAVVPYQPFVEALRPYVTAASPSSLNEQLRGLGHDLARLFPELDGRFPELAPVVAVDAETERYRLFEAVANLLNGIGRGQPALVVLDDLQWASRATLVLLRHVIRSTPNAAMLFLITFRDAGMDRSAALDELFAELEREPQVTRVVLTGLSEPEVADLVGARSGTSASDDVITELYRVTDGSPFFVAELVRHLLDTGAWTSVLERSTPFDLDRLGLPHGVRALVAHRLRRVDESVRETLAVASVVGPAFDFDLLATASERPAPEVLDALDRASRAGLVRSVDGRPGRYAFAHDLVRQAVYDELGVAARAHAHADVGRALEGRGASSREDVLALARHLSLAAPLGDPARAIECLARAGQLALTELAFDEAPGHLQRALELLDEHRPHDTERRIDLLIDLGDALLYTDQLAGEQAAFRAIGAARDADAHEAFARAVLLYCRSAVELGPDESTLLDEARVRLGTEHGALRARLMAVEAFKRATYVMTDHEDGQALAARALDLARTVDDPETLGDALFTRAVSAPVALTPDARLALGQELVALGERAGPGPWTQGLRVLAVAHLEAADAEGLDATIHELRQVGERAHWLPATAFAAQWEATRALFEGRFEDFSRWSASMLDQTRAYRGVAAMAVVQRYYFDREQGRVPSLAMLEEAARARPGNRYLLSMCAAAQLEAGEPERARTSLDALATDQFAAVARESGAPASLALLSEVTSVVGSDAQRAALAAVLEPYRERMLVSLLGLACLGATERHLAMLAAASGRSDDAAADFAIAANRERTLGATAALTRHAALAGSNPLG